MDFQVQKSLQQENAKLVPCQSESGERLWIHQSDNEEYYPTSYRCRCFGISVSSTNGRRSSKKIGAKSSKQACSYHCRVSGKTPVPADVSEPIQVFITKFSNFMLGLFSF